MKGWLVPSPGSMLALVEKEDPYPGPGEVVVKIVATGLCHSDINLLKDPQWMPFRMNSGRILGHECAGIVAALGEDVTGWHEGDRVGVNPVDALQQKTLGFMRDGAYATHCVVPASQLVALPDDVGFVQGAAAADTGLTAYHALFTEGHAEVGMRVGVIGIGGVGQFVAQMAHIRGCTVFAADVDEGARSLAMSLGCTRVYPDVRDMAVDRPSLIIDCAGFGSTTAGAIEAIAPDGTVVIVGRGVLETTVSTYLIISKHITLKGSWGGSNNDLAKVYAHYEAGLLTPNLKEISFEDIGRTMQQLTSQKSNGHIIAVI